MTLTYVESRVHAPRQGVLVLFVCVPVFIQNMHTGPITASAIYLENEP